LLPEFCEEFEKLNLGWVLNIQKGQHADAKIEEIKE
jgi:hypothetical protein